MKSSMRNVIAGLATVAMVALGVNAYAGKGMGYQNDGDNQHRRKGGCPNGYRNADLTPEQREHVDAARQAYLDATRQDRQDLYAKQLELRAELAQRNPDQQKAAGIQKAVSELQAVLDQKRLEHTMTMRKIDPNAGRGFFMDHGGRGHHGMGPGMGPGRGMGNGDCRYQ